MDHFMLIGPKITQNPSLPSERAAAKKYAFWGPKICKIIFMQVLTVLHEYH